MTRKSASPASVPTTPLPSLHLSEDTHRSSPNLLASLSEAEYARLRMVSPILDFSTGETVFRQGDHHEGIFVILAGRVRVYYGGPSGREITLAYWTPGNFIGGPEIFGGSPHMWSGEAVRPTQVLHVHGPELRRQAERSPRLAMALIDAMVHKGKCFSALIHMLGTRSATERLAQLLVLMGDLEGRRLPEGIAISRDLTQDELAKMVGSSRQWIYSTLERFRKERLVELGSDRILILNEEVLRQYAE
jgi:cAMP-binding proteins - catabolite gene activator and regulatory subunit of cAMP-dependent protein kinases